MGLHNRILRLQRQHVRTDAALSLAGSGALVCLERPAGEYSHDDRQWSGGRRRRERRLVDVEAGDLLLPRIVPHDVPRDLRQRGAAAMAAL
mmetsp:Transcript_47449/g.110207  ORF Transcript_47449/g.110207 Transcript_47449/m.110207 type:complete len:91 (+) Transcript_47449:108-380(+)